MEALGRHILAELYSCDNKILNDKNLIEKIMCDAAIKANAEILKIAFHKFSPQGISGVVVISESHLTIHTWPELGYAAVDIFTCGTKMDPWIACDYIKKSIGCKKSLFQEIKRGLFDHQDVN
jgi:S-adenosylmethionine decarboxylase